MPHPKTPPRTRRVRRINVRGLLILGGVVLAAVAGYFPWMMWSDHRVRQSALDQAAASVAKGDVDRALRYLERSLSTWPDDIPTLEAAAKLRFDSSGSVDEAVRAAKLNDQLIRLDPNGPGRQETRRRLVKLWIRQGDAVRQFASATKDSSVEANESRYRAAATVARQLIAKGADDAEAHRLLAQSLDGLVLSGDPSALPEVIVEFEKALQLDPGDATSAERLAQIDRETKNNPAGAQARLDALLEARPDSVDVRMARYRSFTRARQDDRAAEELKAAIAVAPADLSLRIRQVSDSLRKGDNVAARAQLDALPEPAREDPRSRMLRGMLEATEQHHDEAIEQWRKGLAAVGGTDQDLTFQLAYALIRLGRLAEARPLVAQYQRLEGDDPRAMGRYLRALLEQRSGHPRRAIEGMERAQDRIPEGMQGELHLMLGRSYEALGDESRALMAYRRSIAASPRSSEARLAVARLLQARSPLEASEEIDRALVQSPDDPSLLYEAGRLQLTRQLAVPAGDRKWRRLEEILDRAARVAPASAGFRALRADYLSATGKAAEAVDLLARSARGEDRKRIEVWLAWATLLEGRGMREEALKALEEAAAPENAGDHARLRLARAVILSHSGRAEAAREVLARDRDKIPRAEQAELSHAQGDLARELGERDAARSSYLEWSRLAPESPEPGLALLALGKLFADDEAARLGQEALRAIGGDREPYGLAAQAINLLRADPTRGGPPPSADLDQAERLIDQLQADAPQLPIVHLLRGILLEYREKLPQAAASYRLAIKDGEMTPALVGLVGVLTRLKSYDQLAELQKKYEEQSARTRRADLSIGFDRISAAASLKSGDTGRAEYYASRIVEQLPDNLEARDILARLLDQIGKPRQAEATLRELVDRRPNDPAAWVALVTFQAIRGQPGDAPKTIDRARTAYKGERPELLLGRCHWLIGELDKATALYASALSKRPDDPITLRNVADFDGATGRLGEQETVLRRALKLDPSASWAGRALALRLSSNNDPAVWAEAWALVAPGSKGSGEGPEDRLVRASVLARSPDVSRRAQAEPAMAGLARDLPASHPVAIEARLRLAQSMLDAGRAAEAASTVAPAADITEPENLAAQALSVEALARSGKPDEAEVRLKKLAAREPKSPRTTASRAWVLKARGQAVEAVAAIEAAVAEAGSTPEGETLALAYYELARKIGPPESLARLAGKIAARWPRDAYLPAMLQLARGQYAEALASARAALEAGSPREALRVGISLAIARRDDPATLKAVDALAERARSKSPKDLDILIFLATLRHIQGRYQEEVALYQEALSLNPPGVAFLNNMAWTLSEGLGRSDEALHQIDEALRRSGRAPQFLDTRGVILSRMGRFPEAITDLEQAARTDPSATVFFHLARTYFKAGRPEDHRRCRDLARNSRLDPKALDPTDRADLDEVMKTP